MARRPPDPESHLDISRTAPDPQAPDGVTRRGFLRASALSAMAGAYLGGCQGGAAPHSGGSGEKEHGDGDSLDIFTPPAEVDRRGGIPYRAFGRTGEKVSILGIGGYHIGVQPSPEDSVSIIRTAIDEGINFLDNAWEYNNGISETRMGIALRDGYRKKVFLMTKVCGRDQKTAMSDLEDSLKRLGTDVNDLWQFHECNYDNDPDLIFARDGAIHAAIKAKEQGKVRFIGFTGHKSPHIHLKMLARDYSWDALQMPLNVLDSHYRSFARQVIPQAVRRGMGIVGMKPLGGDGGIPQDGGVTVEECLRYSFSLHIPICLSGMDTIERLKQNIEIARKFKPLSHPERDALLAKVAPIAGDGRLEKFKSTQGFDSSVHRKQHGFPV